MLVSGSSPADAGPPAPCDSGLALDSSDPADAAAALGICEGLQAAEWLLPDGDAPPMGSFASGHGLLDDFGPNVLPQEGVRFLVLSSGSARSSSDPGFSLQLDKGYQHGLPAGFPATPSPSCPSPGPGANDGIALQVTVQAPPAAGGLAFDWTYYTRDFPEWVCSSFSDYAAVTLEGTNVLFGPDALPAGSNTPMDVCTSSPLAPNSPCSQGTGGLAGTGFDQPSAADGGATGWQTSIAPVTPGGTYILMFAIWDNGDGISDSTILFDNWRWFADTDSDGVPDESDNCPTVANAVGQSDDADGDLAGNACDAPGTGNVDCNHAVNSVDALKILRHSAGLSVSQSEPCLDIGQPLASTFDHGDVDCSAGNPSAVDALKVLRAVAALPVSQAKGCDPVIGP